MTANAACSFEEVDELAEGEGGDCREWRCGCWALRRRYVRCGCRVLPYLVYFVDAFACDVVEAVEVRLVGGMRKFVLGLFYRNHGFEDYAFAFLYPLTHGMEVGGIVDGSGENTLMVFAFAFAVELFPPFAEEVEFGAVVDENFRFSCLRGRARCEWLHR